MEMSQWESQKGEAGEERKKTKRRQKGEREAYEVVLSVRLEIDGCIDVSRRKSSSSDVVA
jgi:hypothetical protein